MGRVLAAAALAAALVPATALAQEEPETSTLPPQDNLSLPDVQAGTGQVAPASNDLQENRATVDLDGYDTFEAAVAAAKLPSPLGQYTALTVTGNTNNNRGWTEDDGDYLKGTFTGVTDLNLDGFTGTFGEYAFQSCKKLAKVRLKAGAEISTFMFNDCTSLKTLACGAEPEDGVVNLTGAGSFGESAFRNSGVDRVHLPADAKVSNSMFLDCTSLKTLACGATGFQDNVIDLTEAASFGESAFGNSSVDWVRLPAGAEVSANMFYGCTSLTTLACGKTGFQNNVIDLTGANPSFGTGVFDSANVDRVRLPEGVEVSANMFHNCKNLTTLACGATDLRDNVIDLTGAASFGESAFGNSSVDWVRLPAGAEVSANMFYGCTSLTTLACGKTGFQNNVIDLTGANPSFGTGVFDSANVDRVRLPEGVEVSANMFHNCKNLTTLACGATDLRDNVIDLTGAASFGESAFGNSSVDWVRLPASAEVSAYMFYGCKNLTTLACGATDLRDGTVDLTGAGSFGNDAFNGSGVNRVRLPAGAEVSNSMFLDCKNLTTLACGATDLQDGTVDLTGANPSFGTGAFNGSGVEKVRLPKDAEVSSSMFATCGSLRTLVCGTAEEAPFVEGVVDLTGAGSLGSGVFTASGVEKARLAADKAVPKDMFYGCESLRTLAFVGAEGGTAPAVPTDAFSLVPNEAGRTLYYPKEATGYGKDEFSSDLSNWARSPYTGLEIGSQPESRVVFAGQDASFSVGGVAGSPEPIGYRWQASDGGPWRDLADGNGYSGTATATLSISKAPAALDGMRYRCVVYNDVQTVPSNAAKLTVKGAPAAGSGSSLASTGDASAAAPLAGLALASGAAAAAAACVARRRRDR